MKIIIILVSFSYLSLCAKYYEESPKVATDEGIWGTKGVYAKDNTPPKSELGNTWVYNHLTDKSLFLFGGNQFFTNGYRAMWQYSLSGSTKNQWRHVHGPAKTTFSEGEETLIDGNYHPGNLPREFSLSGTVCTSSNSLLMIGGGVIGTWKLYLDIWEYSPEKTMWRKLYNHTTKNPVYGTEKEYSKENHPFRTSNWFFFNNGNDEFITISGAISETHFLTQIWEYSATKNQWRFLKGGKIMDDKTGNYPQIAGKCTIDNYPSSRAAPSVWQIGTDLYMYGGIWYTSARRSLFQNELTYNGEFHTKSDVWKFDRSTDVWCWIAGTKRENEEERVVEKFRYDSRNSPGSYAGAITWTDGIDKLYAGYGVGKYSDEAIGTNSVFVFDTNKLQWKFSNGTTVDEAEKSDLPLKSVGQSFWFVSMNEIYTFGGISIDVDGEILDGTKLWVYSKQEFSCGEIDMDDVANVCNGHGSCILGKCKCSDGYYGSECNNAPASAALVALVIVTPLLFVVILILTVVVAVILAAFLVEKGLRKGGKRIIPHDKDQKGNRYFTFEDNIKIRFKKH